MLIGFNDNTTQNVNILSCITTEFFIFQPICYKNGITVATILVDRCRSRESIRSTKILVSNANFASLLK